MESSRWWILAALTLDSTLAARPGQLDVANGMGTSSWRVTNVVGTSNWRVTDAVGKANVMGAAPVTSALTNSGMNTTFSQFHATLVKYRFLCQIFSNLELHCFSRFLS
jgi:hypothetical protein